MSAHHHMKLALAALRSCRTRTSRAREYARAVRMDDEALKLLQELALFESVLQRFTNDVELAEATRRTNACRQGRRAA